MAAQPVDALIDVRNVHKIFGNGTVAIKDMSLTISEGEFVSFLGPSGCGKSTALKMIAGLLSVSAGEIDVNGHPAGQGGETGDIGYVFQDATLMPWANVFDNVFLPLRLQGVSRRDATPRITEVLAQVGLSKFHKSYPRELSGGMKMRVSIARALVTNPKLLLLDEPFAALDEITRFKLNNDVLRLWEENNLTVIFVTHSVFESVYMSSRVVLMGARPGRVIEEIELPRAVGRTDEYRTSAEFGEHARTVTQALERTMTNVDH
ncbi:ABC transporter ATP-binding protein [Sulfitobacter sp. F26169L]|uniref:ABC transporter ATP-binding protein n=1 Tax=Sulfitobacter sp. F26169L TaxID=2996015 RepID=UPI002260BF13|nr:ABC transporter ATP-binding protein [Sulfitobacter sp. F26169L]MCX7568123.1 ABC transporter ATP-binding protein [Sulfitobacter sp. F26169L]